MFRAYADFWNKMFVFNATATRFQYWTAWIINTIVIGLYAYLTHQEQYVVKGVYNMAADSNSMIFVLILILAWVANFTIRARRLHDSNHSNWWLFITIIPFIGNLWLFILLLMPTVKNNRWPVNQSNY